MLGITFKENCPDIRNTRAIDILDELKEFDVVTDVFDPWANPVEVKKELGINLISELDLLEYDSIILAVSHSQFKDLDFEAAKKNDCVIFDVKSFLPREIVNSRL
jgi:UDP-N-acetyl-D-galactosamine dehydrogenase